MPQRQRSKRSAQAQQKGSIRIISGQWRGRKLPVLSAQGLRPTTDSTKETLFNWLMHDVYDANCLDLFAGSGGLGFEALSRGAASVTMVEQYPPGAAQLRENAQQLKLSSEQLEVVQGDALRYLSACQRAFNIIFLDPPFEQNLLQPALDAIFSAGLLATDGLIYIEAEKALDFDASHYPLALKKQKSTHQVTYSLWSSRIG
ncbi:16S rRNA (guanine(966)-N(2))-methyltransferase RsmD [Alteromonas sp. SM 2104]|nr:16S rRNA (guanine(966)-N(2))-methyltransferase RsmD [Alteromonas oceanisediminis]